MKSLTSQAALKSLAKAEFVVMSARTQKAGVSARLTQLFSADPAGDGEGMPPMPDWDVLLESHAGLLERATQEVRDADQAHRLNLVEAAQLRKERRAVVAELLERHRDLRKTFTGTYGEEALALVGLDAVPAQRIVAIREHALEVYERMRNPELAARLPEPRSGQPAIDPAQIAVGMEGLLGRFEEILEAIERQGKVSNESIVAKYAALERHRRIYANVIHAHEAYYRLVGLDDLAARIRSPEPRRRRAKPEEAEETSGEGEESPEPS